MRPKPFTSWHHFAHAASSSTMVSGSFDVAQHEEVEPVDGADALERAVDGPQAGEHARHRLVGDRHDDRGADFAVVIRHRRLGGVACRRPVMAKRSRPRASVWKPNSAVQNPSDTQPNSTPKKATVATSTHVPPRFGSTFTMKPLAMTVGTSTRSTSSRRRRWATRIHGKERRRRRSGLPYSTGPASLCGAAEALRPADRLVTHRAPSQGRHRQPRESPAT